MAVYGISEYMELRLTDGATTVSLVDAANYALAAGGWPPGVSRRTLSRLGGQSSYAPVEEEIQVNVFGNTTAEALAAVEALAELLDQADAWAMGRHVKPVWIQARAQGSTLSDPLQALVLEGNAGRPFIAPPPTYNDNLMVAEVGPITIRFVRTGLWLDANQTEAGTAVGVYGLSNPDVMRVNFGQALPLLAPTTIKITNFPAGAQLIDDAYVLYTDAPVESTYGTNFKICNTSSMMATNFTSVADTANHAHNGGVFRIDAGVSQTGSLTENIQAEVREIAIFAAVRNNSTSTTWRMRAVSSGYAEIYGNWATIDAASQTPRIIALGKLSNESGIHTTIGIEVETDDTSGTLDVNYVVPLPYGASAGYIGITGKAYNADGFTRNLVLDPRELTHKHPLVYIETAD